MAQDQKKAKRQKAHLIFIDESGVLTTPLIKRTWAPKGHRPILAYRGSRQKVSIVGALCLSPKRKRLALHSKILTNDYFNNEKVTEFIKQLLISIPGKIIIIWDSGNIHKGDPIRNLMENFKSRLTLEKFPPYAPQLNPVEQIWNWLKFNRLANFTPRDAKQIRHTIVPMLAWAACNKKQLKKFWQVSELPLPRTLLS